MTATKWAIAIFPDGAVSAFQPDRQAEPNGADFIAQASSRIKTQADAINWGAKVRSPLHIACGDGAQKVIDDVSRVIEG